MLCMPLQYTARNTQCICRLKLTICVHAVKPGQCPKPKNTPECAESCFHDGQCPETQKCCPTTCGHAC
uniref:WAP domain-containing protein n=1 Tax=Cyprinus carpio TaxID=7962 RepID=A0A8C2JVW2_CYPCA